MPITWRNGKVFASLACVFGRGLAAEAVKSERLGEWFGPKTYLGAKWYVLSCAAQLIFSTKKAL